MSSFGVLIYVIAGNPKLSEASQIDDIQASEQKIITQQMQALRDEKAAALDDNEDSDTDSDDPDKDGSPSPQPVPQPAAEPDSVA